MIVVLVPFLLVAGISLGMYRWYHGALPGFRPTAVDVTPATINRDHRGVRLVGTAHYGARLKQTSQDGSETWFLYPVLEKGDTLGKNIRAVVRTTQAPNELYGFEDITVEGFARPPGRLMPTHARRAMADEGYFLEEGFVLVEVWED